MNTKIQGKARIERIKKVWTPEAHLHIPYGDEEITFAYPSFGSDNYQNLGKEILSKGLKLPGKEYASLLHAAYCSKLKDEPEFENVREMMRTKWLYPFLQDFGIDKGMYVIDDEYARGRSETITIKGLEERLRGGKDIKGTNVRISNDKKVRFAPKESDNYRLGEQTPEQLARNDMVIAQYLKEGAEQLAEVSASDIFGFNPYVYGLDITEGQVPELRFSALGDYGGWLRVFGCGYFGGGGSGRSFGVFK